MANINRLYQLSHLLLRLFTLLGFTAAFVYDGANFKLEQMVCTFRGSYAMFFMLLNTAAPCVYIGIRLVVDWTYNMLNSIAPGAYRTFDSHALLCDVFGALVYMVLCIKFYTRRRQMLQTLNETLQIVQSVQQIAKSYFSCAMLALAVAYLLLLQSVLRPLWTLLRVPGRTDTSNSSLEYVGTLLLCFCDVFQQLHLIVYFLHFVLQSRLYYALNKFIEHRMSGRRLRTLQKLLLLQPRIQQLHCFASRYFAYYLGCLQLCVYNDLNSLMACFKYDDNTLAYQRGQLNDGVDTVEPILLGVPIITLQPYKIVMAFLALMWSVGQVLLLLYAAWLHYREKSLFEMQLLHLANYPEYFQQRNEQAAVAYDVTQTQSSTIDEIEQFIPKHSIYDLMLDANMNLIDFAGENMVTLRAFRLEVRLRPLIWTFTMLFSCGLLMVVEDIRQQEEIRILEKLSKQ